MGTVLVAISDVMFMSKVDATARQLGVAYARAQRGAALADEVARTGATRVLLDLASPSWGGAQGAASLQGLGVEVVGYCRHTSEALLEEGRAAGCSQVLTQGEFSAHLARLLQP